MIKPLALVFYEKLLPGSQLLNRLQDEGYRVLPLSSAAALSETAAREKPFLVVADLFCVRGDICAAIRQLRDNPATGHVPVLAFASGRDAVLQSSAREAGATLVSSEAGIVEQLPDLLEQLMQIEENRPAPTPVPVEPITKTSENLPAPAMNPVQSPAPTAEATPTAGIKLQQGIHAIHLFYRIDRVRWESLADADRGRARDSLSELLSANSAPSHPRITSFVTVGGKADLAFMILAADLMEVSRLHRDLEGCFPAGSLDKVFSYLSVTELSEYGTTDDDNRQMLAEQENLSPGTEVFEKRLVELRDRIKKYEHYRLYPEMPDWEVMGFYPMSKRRLGNDNWYSLDFAARKKLMAGHARVGRKFAGRVSQLITGSTGLDDWEWGVTLMAHQTDALKEIVYEMRFDEVTARYGEFGPFFVNVRLSPAAIWEHLGL